MPFDIWSIIHVGNDINNNDAYDNFFRNNLQILVIVAWKIFQLIKT